MKKSEILARLSEIGLRGETITFYSTYDREKSACVDSPNTSFGDCEISGIVGNLVNCCALGNDGKIYNFQAGEWLVSGHLSKIAGSF